MNIFCAPEPSLSLSQVLDTIAKMLLNVWFNGVFNHISPTHCALL